MKKALIFKGLLVMILVTLTSCETDDLVEKNLRGEWIEVSPVTERTTLIFSSENKMSRIDGEGNREEYTYRIDGDSIFLSLTEGQEGSTELYFNKLDPARFKIGNLYPSIPESEEVIMTFERN